MRPARCWRVAGPATRKPRSGTGFTLPPLSTPMPSVQPWFRIPADRLADTDRAFLDTVNPVLAQAGLAELPTVRVAVRWRGAVPSRGARARPLSNSAGPNIPGRDRAAAVAHVLPELPPESDGGVFVYLSATNRFLEPVLNALKARNVRVDAYIAGTTSAPGTSIQAPNIHYLQTPVDLKRVAVRCRLAITHGGTLSASMLLRRGARLLVCPEDLEKAVLGQRLVDRKLAYSFNWFAPDADDVAATLGNVLDSTATPERSCRIRGEPCRSARRRQRRYRPWPGAKARWNLLFQEGTMIKRRFWVRSAPPQWSEGLSGPWIIKGLIGNYPGHMGQISVFVSSPRRGPLSASPRGP